MLSDNFYAHSVREVFTALKSSKEGLSSRVAEARLREHGRNLLFKETRFKTLRLLISQFKNFFVILLIFAAALSFFFESPVNGAVLIFVALLNVSVSFIQERKAEQTIEKLRQIYPAKVYVLRDHEEKTILAEEVVVGDVVVLREGEAVPADLRLFEVRDLKLDEAVLTGESTPAEKTVKTLPEGVSLADRKNTAFVGTLVVAGSGKGVVINTGGETEFGKIAAFTQEQEERSLLLERVAHLAVWLTGIAAALSLLVFFLGALRDVQLIHTVNFAIAVFVSAVPESLPTTTTLALALTALRLSRKKALVRHLPTSETLSGVNLFAFDKTGTLTLNELSVARIVLPDRQFEVTGTGFTSVGDVLENGRKISASQNQPLRAYVEAAALSSAAKILPIGDNGGPHWTVHGDPTEGAFLILAEKVGIPVDSAANLKEDFVFTSQRRMRSRVFVQDDVLAVYSLGAPEEIIKRCSTVLKDGERVPLSSGEKDELEAQAHELARQGYRVLAAATKSYRPQRLSQEGAEQELVFLGIAGLLDRPKERVAETFKSLEEAGISPIIVTGDHPGTTLAVAKSLGLSASEKMLITGEQFEEMSDEELLKVIPKVKIYARIAPTQKYRLVKLARRLGLRVAVSGDGVNDAPALKQADVGVVMGRKGTEVSKDAADLVIMDDNIETVLPAIAEARTLYDNIKKFFTFLLSGNFEELLIIAGALILHLPQPFTTLQILWINFVTDALPAFALAYDPPEKNILKTKPRDLSRRMIRPIVLYAIFLGFISLVGEALLFVNYLPDVARARTLIFTGAVLFELFIVFSIRTEDFFLRGVFANRFLTFAFVSSLILQIAAVYFTPLNEIMSTVPLNLRDWLVIFGFIAGSLAIVETVKWFDRRGSPS